MLDLAKLKQFHWPLLLLIIANGLIIVNTPPYLRYVAALLLLAFLPGWIWLDAYFKPPVDLAERLTLAVGLSLALSIIGTMFAVYLPGSLTALKLLVVADLLAVAGLVLRWWSRSAFSEVAEPSPPHRSANHRSVSIIIVLLILAAALRLPHLGYAEFHEDEAEALMLSVRLFQGEDYALFLHRKGPAQMLVPVAFWLLTGRLTETIARFPFALSSILSVITLFFIGRRWFHWLAGAIAGLLWAINGYAIGFGRMVQYQALIFYLGPLAIYVLYLAWKYYRPRLQIFGTILLAACLLAHFDALLLLPVAGYLSWRAATRLKAREAGGRMKSLSPRPHRSAAPLLRSPVAATLVALTLFVGLLASFYVPYMLDPEFKNTASYLSQSRVKPGLLYNNSELLSDLDQDYSSQFYLPLLALGFISYVSWQSKDFTKLSQWGLLGLGLLLASTFWLPGAWQVGQLSIAVLPWLILFSVFFYRSANVASKAAWVMFGAAFLGYVFLVDDPRTHLYIIYPGAVLLAGAGLHYLRYFDFAPFVFAQDRQHRFWMYDLRLVPKTAIRAFASMVIVLVALIVIYESLIFLRTESNLAQLRHSWDGSLWQTVYDDLPDARTYFGYPKREGWKAIGALRAQGMFPGDFRSVNEDFIIPIWYNYGQARSCYNTPAHFFVRSTGGEIPSTAKDYVEVGQVQREGEIRLHILSAEARTESEPTTYSLAAYSDTFDQMATPQQFAQQSAPSQLVEAQFGSNIKFVGYDLPEATVAPGDILDVNLYWQALDRPEDHYRTFVHLTDGQRLWGQQDDEPACRLPTTIWRPEQRSVGQFRLPIDADTPPGRYPLIIGLYRADTLKRLEITAGAGQPGDDFLWLGDIEVVK